MTMMMMWIDMIWQRRIIIDDHNDDHDHDEENDHDNDYDHGHDHNHDCDYDYDHDHDHDYDHDYSDLFCTDTFKGQKKILYNHGLNKTNF